MTKNYKNDALSDLEREFELAMEDTIMPDDDMELEREFESVMDIVENQNEEYDEDNRNSDYAERFYELSTREFELESELDQEVNDILDEIERDFFFKKMFKKIKKGAKGLAKKAFRYGKRYLKKTSPFNMFKGISSLARGDLKGLLGSLAKTAIGTAVPGGSFIAPALSALGFEAEMEGPNMNREFWDKFVQVSREAYDYMVENIDESADDPLVASELAGDSFRNAVNKVFVGRPFPKARSLSAPGKRQRIRAVRGDIIEIKIL